MPITAVTICALLGFSLSAYIFRKHQTNEKFVCIIGSDCNIVINSRYNRLLGVDNECLGMLYYASVVIVAGVLMTAGVTALGIPIGWFLLGAATVSAIFGVVLSGIQFFILNEFCEYCLTSAALSILIFLIQASNYFDII